MRTEGLEVGMGPGIDVSDVQVTDLDRSGRWVIHFRAVVRDDAPAGPRALTVRAGSTRVRRENAFVVVQP